MLKKRLFFNSTNFQESLINRKFKITAYLWNQYKSLCDQFTKKKSDPKLLNVSLHYKIVGKICLNVFWVDATKSCSKHRKSIIQKLCSLFRMLVKEDMNREEVILLLYRSGASKHQSHSHSLNTDSRFAWRCDFFFILVVGNSVCKDRTFFHLKHFWKPFPSPHAVNKHFLFGSPPADDFPPCSHPKESWGGTNCM